MLLGFALSYVHVVHVPNSAQHDKKHTAAVTTNYIKSLLITRHVTLALTSTLAATNNAVMPIS